MCKKTNHNQLDECFDGYLYGLANACCGHGSEREAYVQFLDGSVVRGYPAILVQDILKKFIEIDNDIIETFKNYKISDFESVKNRNN